MSEQGNFYPQRAESTQHAEGTSMPQAHASHGRVTFKNLQYCHQDTLAVYLLDTVKTITCKKLNQLDAEYTYFE